ncbi:transglycosylase SLT domain-containing protein [Nocardia mexicana]|uniref:Transglycosylase-like protein with SLT domain n=1 Tax=Nocardia mexicana TaxID=279262 RepID=A0A370GPW4_9NOCA|nr:transglycosylase SLT domain-containing protein [Nocardia mexicana]RDI45350.1 transglycosylase-like protein with SLT domain [Nocardia mexicana]
MAERWYQVKPLPHPEGSSEALDDFIDWGGRVIEAILSILGSGDATLPDYTHELEGDRRVVEIDDQSNSVTVNNYKELAATISAAEESIRVSDRGVDTSAFATSGIADNAFDDVKSYAKELRRALEDAPAPLQDEPTPERPNPPKYLTASTEMRLMSAVADAVDKTHDRVAEAQADIQRQAEAISRSTPSDTGNGHSSGGDGSNSVGGIPANYSSPVALQPVDGTGGYDSSYTQPVDSLGGNAEHDTLSHAELEYYIGKALDSLGITDPRARERWTQGYLTLIKRESGGDTGAINLSDSNAAAGHPSQGLTQTIPSTFEAYHVAGTSRSITDPTANIAASMNYVMNRYEVSRDGSNLASNVQQADPYRSPKGY